MRRHILIIGLVLGCSLSGSQRTVAQNSALTAKALMTPADFDAAGLDKLSSAELAALDRWLAKLVAAVSEASKQQGNAAPQRTTPQASRPLSITDLEGTIVVAQDGQALGLITTNCFGSDALCNEFGNYGNRFSSKSILNEFSNYGSEFSSKSPFNQFTTTPPKIYKDSQFVAYLSLNSALSPRVDPMWLLGALKIKR